MEISVESAMAMQGAGQKQQLQVGLMRKAMDMNEQAASQILDTLPSYNVDTSAPAGQQVRIKA